MKYKLLINGTKVDEYNQIISLVQSLFQLVKPGDRVELWERARTRWQLMDGCIWE